MQNSTVRFVTRCLCAWCIFRYF